MSFIGEVARIQLKLYSPERRRDTLERLEAFVQLPSPTGIEPWADTSLLYRGKSPLRKIPESIRRPLALVFDPIGVNPFLARSGLLFDILPKEEQTRMLATEKKVDVQALRHALRPVQLGSPSQELAVFGELAKRLPGARKMPTLA